MKWPRDNCKCHNNPGGQKLLIKARRPSQTDVVAPEAGFNHKLKLDTITTSTYSTRSNL